MLEYVSAFAASFVFIGLRAFQQLNVTLYQYRFIVPTSVLMAACEVYLIALIATRGFGWIVLWIGVGSGLGCLFAMWLHKRLRT